MIRCIDDPKYNYKSIFNTKTGAYMRFSDSPMASFPHLIDIGVQGHCEHGKSGLCLKAGIKCYQNGLTTNNPNMKLEDFKRIIDEIKDNTFQCLHEDEIVLVKQKYTGKTVSTCIKNVEIGDMVYTGDADKPFAKVTNISHSTNEGFMIKLPYGKSIIATDSHKFPLKDGRLVTVSELKHDDVLIDADIQVESLYRVDAVKSILDENCGHMFYLKGDEVKRYYGKSTVRIDSIKNDIDKFDYEKCHISVERSQWTLNTFYDITEDLMVLLGHYVGNGSKRSFVISKNQVAMVNQIQNALSIVFPSFSYNTRTRNETVIIECSSFLPARIFDIVFGCRNKETKQKQLPNFIYNISYEMKAAFLQGYFCDGNLSICTNDGTYASVTFNTSSLKLYHDLVTLLRSMEIGYVCRTEGEKDVPFSRKDPRIIHRKKRYRVSISNLYELHKIPDVAAKHKYGERLQTVLNTQHQTRGLREYKKPLTVQEIVNIGRINVVDINIDSDKHLFVTTHGIITHNCALGGRGDPDMHENFEELLHYAATNNVVPNFTTSGFGMTPEKAAICKAYCGAVACSMYTRITDKPVVAWRKRLKNEAHVPYKTIKDIPIMFALNNMNPNCYTEGENFVIHNKDYGWYYLHHFENYKDMYMNGDFELYRIYEEKQESNYTLKAINMLLKAGVTTNIHYVLSNTTIDEAILRLKYNGFPSGINAVIFLLHKPVGLGDESDVLKYDDPRLTEFFALIDQKHDFKIGFDSCTVPALLNFSKNIDLNSVDTCEAARFSMYITSDMIALPCSFDNVNQKYAFDLKNGSIQDAWNSKAFERFRVSFKTSCSKCSDRKKCLGGCPLEPSITLCNRKEKDRWL